MPPLTLRERGAAAVEFALVVPILIALVLGIADFGRAYMLESTLYTAAREGARYGAIHGEATTDEVRLKALAAAHNMGIPVAGTTAIAENTCATTEDNVSVTVDSAFDFFLPLSDITITATGVMRCGG